MTRFGQVLHDIDTALDVPQPAKSRILLELAADMADYYERCRQDGLGETQARQQVEQRFAPSRATLDELTDLHTRRVTKSLRRLSHPVGRIVEAAAILLPALLVGLVTAPLLRGTEFLRLAGPVAWVVGATIVASLVIATPTAARLWLRQDHDVARLRRGLDAVAASIVVSIAIAAATHVRLVADALNRLASGAADVSILVAMRQLAASATVAFLGVLLCALLWFLLRGEIARIHHASGAYLRQG